MVGTGEVTFSVHGRSGHSLSIKDFELGQVIGEGSFGFVLLARLKAPPTYFAIKVCLF